MRHLLTKASEIGLLSIGLMISATQAVHAASLSVGAETQVSDGSKTNISVVDGSAGYSGFSNSGTFGDGTAEAYGLFRTADVGGVLTDIEYANKGGRTTSITTNGTAGDNLYEMHLLDAWTTTDPGSNFSTTADFIGVDGGEGGSNTGFNTIAGSLVTSLTIDLTGLSSGTFYLLVGQYENVINFTATLSGTGQTDIVNTDLSFDPPPSRNMYVVPYTFDTSAGNYDTLTLEQTTGASNRARFAGYVIDAAAIPEPSAALLGLLGSLLLLRRRRH